MKLLFVYGTLKQGSYNNAMLCGSKFVGRAVTKPSLNIKSVSVPIVVTPFTDDMRKTAKPIIGEVYKISKKTLRIVDILEGHPELYKRFIIDVELEGDTVEAYIYLFQPGNFVRTPDFDQPETDCSIKVTEEGYEWVEARCPTCNTVLDMIQDSVGVCYTCKKIVEL
jgi:gamma-glutamylcyclotransferase (GGCT)/AIG2-like uncharacterized protein YtfP